MSDASFRDPFTKRALFYPPPLDNSFSLPTVYEWHEEHNKDSAAFIFAGDDGNITTIRWPEVARAARVASRIVVNRMELGNKSIRGSVIAILAPSESISYSTMVVGIMLANYVPFPISPRNSAEAIAHLIDKTGVEHIFIGHEESMRVLVQDALNLLLRRPSWSAPKPGLSHLPLYQELFLVPSETSHTIARDTTDVKRREEIAMILHSSGSTSFPKPIYWTHGRIAQLALAPSFGHRELGGQIFSVHAAPMFHAAGLIPLCWMVASGMVFSAFEPKTPAALPTPDAVFQAARATNSDLVFVAPAFIEAWSRNPEYVQWFASRKGLLYCGGPLSKEAGNHMVSNGVSIVNILSSTEVGPVSPIFPVAEVNRDWEHFTFSSMVTTETIPFGNVPDVFELVIVTNETCRPSVINTKVNGVDAYATSDLLQAHPTKPGHWRIFGRSDDQIMHSTGEKTNPGPLENILNQDIHVLSSVIFGRGRFQAGVLVQPKPEFTFDPTNESLSAEFRNKIWPTVERLNVYAPQHSRLFKEMIIVAKPSRPFTYTAKSTPRRQAIIASYEEEINGLYEAVEETTQINVPVPHQWDLTPTIGFVRDIVNKLLLREVKDEDDFFEQGCDSLQATWIRNSIFRALRESVKMDTRKIAGNCVYEHPSVIRLASFISSLVTGTSNGPEASHAESIGTMLAMVAKYSEDFPIHQKSWPEPQVNGVNGYVVLVTGTTGGLGCHLLAQLAADPEVSRIYALNRSSRDIPLLYERQKMALAKRGLAVSILDEPKIILLEGELSKPEFGLHSDTYMEMQRTVTHVIHNAWPVDFNLTLRSFEPNIQGLRHLINFALTSPRSEPPQFIYISSVGVFQNFEYDETYAENQISEEVAVGQGYAESKWVSEEILHRAMNQTALETLSVRVGQLCGADNGSWNVDEWFPAMVQSAQILGVFPDTNEDVAWVTPQIAAAALIEFCKSPRSHKVVHLIHPRPVSWHVIAAAVASELSVPLVPYAEWLAKLGSISNSFPGGDPKSGSSAKIEHKMRALRLLPFFEALATKAPHEGTLRFPALEVKNALILSPTLAEPALPQLDARDVKSWVTYWRGIGLLS